MELAGVHGPRTLIEATWESSWKTQQADNILWKSVVRNTLKTVSQNQPTILPAWVAIELLSSVTKSLTSLVVNIFGTFRDFHEFAVTSPVGYYAGNRATIGDVGADFSTSPCIFSPFFGQLLAFQLHDMFSAMLAAEDITDSDEPFYIWEIGPGTGQLAHDVLQTLHANQNQSATWNLLWKKIQYHLVEPSSKFAQLQAERLGTFPSNKYKITISPIQSYQTDSKAKGICLCNELHDDLARQRMTIGPAGQVLVPLPVPIIETHILAYLCKLEEIAELKAKHDVYTTILGPVKGLDISKPNTLLLSAEDYRKLKLRAFRWAIMEQAFDRCVQFVDLRVPKGNDFPELDAFFEYNQSNLLDIQRLPKNANITASTTALHGTADIHHKKVRQPTFDIFDAQESFSAFANAMQHTGHVVMIDYGQGRGNFLLGSAANHLMFRKYPRNAAQGLFQEPCRTNITFDVSFHGLAKCMKTNGWKKVWYGTENGLLHVLDGQSPPNWLADMRQTYGINYCVWLWNAQQLSFKMLNMKSENLRSDYSVPAVSGSLEGIPKTCALDLEYSDVENGQVDLLARLVIQHIMNEFAGGLSDITKRVMTSNLVHDAIGYVKRRYNNGQDTEIPLENIIEHLVICVVSGDMLNVIRYCDATDKEWPLPISAFGKNPLPKKYALAFMRNLEVMYLEWPDEFDAIQTLPEIYEQIIQGESIKPHALSASETSIHGQNALQLTALLGNLVALKKLLASMTGHPHTHKDTLDSALVSACLWNQESSVIHLLEFYKKHRIDPIAACMSGLCHAISLGHDRIAVRLAVRPVCTQWGVARTYPNHNPLHFAAARRNTALANRLIEQGMHPDASDNINQTALHIAAQGGDTAMAESLLQHGSNPFQSDVYGKIPIEHAIDKGHLDAGRAIYTCMLNHHPGLASNQPLAARIISTGKWKVVISLLQGGLDPQSALPYALASGNADLILSVLAFLPEPCLPKEFDESKLADQQAAANMRIMRQNPERLLELCTKRQLGPIVTHLVTNGHPPHTPNPQHSPLLASLRLPDVAIRRTLIQAYTGSVSPETAMVAAIEAGDLNAIRAFGQKGIPLETAERCGTPLAQLGVRSISPSILKYLFETTEIDPNRYSPGDATSALGAAISLEVPEETICKLVAILQAHGARLDNPIAPSGFETPLHLALRKKRPQVALQLLALGARASARNATAETSLHIAAANGLLDCMSALVAAGVSPNARDMDRRTPMHSIMASREDMPKEVVFEALKTLGGDPALKDSNGYTPQQYIMFPC